MTEVRQPREVDMVPQELRFVPQVKSDIIIQRRNVTLAPIEAADKYTRNGTNTITFNVQGHRELSQLLDAKSVYFTWQAKFKGAYPVEDVSMLVEEVIISSNGRTLERIRHAQYIQKFLRGYGMSRSAKARLGEREGFQRFEDRTVQQYRQPVVAAGGAVSTFGYGFMKAKRTDTAATIAANAGAGPVNNAIRGESGYTDQCDDHASWLNFSRMSDNLGYHKTQVQRSAIGANNAANWGTGSILAAEFGSEKVMKFRLPCSGLLDSEKMLPIGWMPLTIQLRLSDPSRACASAQLNGVFDYEISRPRMHINVCSVGQAYASAMGSRLRGPGITLNCKMFDTFFQLITGDKQIVIPSNKQRLSKVWVMFHDDNATNDAKHDAFRSSVTGMPCYRDKANNNLSYALRSYQFQVGTEVSEAVSLEPSAQVGLNPVAANRATGMPFLEAYLRAIGAVNGQEQTKEFWGKDLDPLKCNNWEGGDLLETFLSKYFVCVYDGEKLLGSQIETGVDTESGKDIVLDLRWATTDQQNQPRNTRVMALIQYHAQIVIKENSVDLSF